MRSSRLWVTLLYTAAWLAGSGNCRRVARAAEKPPLEWIDAQTGHRVVRLSREPGSQSLYFHQYPFTADGKKMVFTAPSGIAEVDLETREVKQVAPEPAHMLMTGRKSGDAYYLLDGVVYAANLHTHESRKIAALPKEFRGPLENTSSDHPAESARRNRGWDAVDVNADETMLVGIGHDPDGKTEPRTAPGGEAVGGRLRPRWVTGEPMVMYTVDVARGVVKVIHRSNDWLNHLQCSPTDPNEIMFCHEGPWHLVDRTWLIRADGTGLTQVQPRTMDMEIAGHEFFSADGRSVWYDLQTPRSLVFWLAGYEIDSGKRTWYHLERKEWSVHYNISPDGQLFCGDGGGPTSVANQSPNSERLDPPQNGQWLYLFRPDFVAKRGLPVQAAKEVRPGVLLAERLVDLSHHNYQLEPNGMFTPDGKWVVFRSNMHGPAHMYAVEVERTR